MTIVLDENAWAKEMIDSKSLGKKPFETLTRVARYYIDHDCSRRETRKKLDSFMLQCDPLASVPKWSKTIDYALGRAMKRKAVHIECIPITKPEIEVIQGLDGKQLQRLAFTLLCLAKYWDIVNETDTGWVNTPDNEIMRMANIGTSSERQSAMYHTLYIIGVIQFAKKVDNTNVRINFIQDGETVMEIRDFRNLGNQYMMYRGEPFFVCKNCGIVTRKHRTEGKAGRKQVYCDACAAKIAVQQRINSVMNGRQKSAAQRDMLKKIDTNSSASEAENSVV